MTKGQDEDMKWHLDRKVPLAIVVAILVQTATFAWWGSKIDSRLNDLERSDSRTQVTIGKIEDDRALSRDRVTRLEEQSKAIVEGIKRVENKLDTLVDRQSRP